MSHFLSHMCLQCCMSSKRNTTLEIRLGPSETSRFLDFSFLCTFVPRSKKSIERTLAPVELLFRETFAPRERKLSKVRELSFHGTFAPLELSLLRRECSKNFRSMEFSHPWNVISKQLLCPITFTPVLKKVVDSNVSIGVFWPTFAELH